MRINVKSEKGAITLVVLVGMIFLTVFLMSLYIQLSNKAQTSSETTKQIAKQYNNIGDADIIYDNYFANIDIIPIFTKEQLAKIGSKEKILIDNKIYTFELDAYYILKNDLDLGGKYDEETGTWSGEEEWTPITDEFTGTLDGLGHTISGLYINNTSDNQGLFGELNGTVKNLIIKNSYVNGKTSGLIAGKKGDEGIIENCIDGEEDNSQDLSENEELES